MKNIRLTYILELELPTDTLVTDGKTFVTVVKRMLRYFSSTHGWKARLSRLTSIDPVPPV